jgi:hypothetical protein
MAFQGKDCPTAYKQKNQNNGATRTVPDESGRREVLTNLQLRCWPADLIDDPLPECVTNPGLGLKNIFSKTAVSNRGRGSSAVQDTAPIPDHRICPQTLGQGSFG